MAVATYDPASTVLIVGSQAHGFVDGEFVSIEYDENLFEDEQGADGEVARIKNPGSMVMVRLTLQQTTTFNAVLSALAVADQLSGTGIVPFLLQEGGTVVAGGECWVKTMPNVAYAKGSLTPREWGLRVAKATTFLIGGNPV